MRQTVYADLNALITAGFDIVIVKSTQNQYFMGNRLFEYPELKMLADAVASSKIISAKKSEALVQKLGCLTSIHQAEQLKGLASLSSRVKPGNEKVYYIIDSIHSAIECSQEQFEKYRHEERHSRYLQEHEGRYLTIPMSDLKDRDQSDEGYEDTDIFVNEEPGTEDMALHNLQLKKLQAALNQLEPSEREFILAYFGMDKPSTIQLGHLFGISQPAALYRQKKILEKLKKLFI